MKASYKLKFTRLASNDLDAIYQYIGDELQNPTAAKLLFEKIEKAFETLKLFPESCPECINEKGYRKLIINKYIAFYKIDENSNQVVVYRVLYGMMDYNKYL